MYVFILFNVHLLDADYQKFLEVLKQPQAMLPSAEEQLDKRLAEQPPGSLVFLLHTHTYSEPATQHLFQVVICAHSKRINNAHMLFVCVYPGTDGIIITPLMEFIRNKKAMKQKLV
jgi:hypothetical protein